MTASIELIEPGKYVKVKPMIYSPDDRVEFTRQINELLEMKLIEPSKSPFMSPAFLVNNDAEKRRGKKRMVINYKKVNEITVSDSHNLPKKEELFALIRDKHIFSSFDCKSGFWQVLLDDKSKPITAFTCPDGHFQWNVVPFGLKQAPSIFQRHMQNAYRGFERFCCIYVDDILVFSNNEQEHYTHVAAVLKRTKDLGIILSLKKAQLFKQDIVFLGIRIHNGKHVPQNHILDNLHKFPDELEDKKQLQRFYGVLTYAETYIPDLAKMKAPLNAKLKKDSIWQWTKEDTEYMRKIKKRLTKFPELYLPKPDDQMIIETDASDKYWGGVLKAKTSSGEELICRYTSGSFKPAEKNYHSSEKEILAVIRVINKFSIYLTPVVFTVRSDYKNLKYFIELNLSGDRNKGRLVRWQAYLSHYNFNVEYIKGDDNFLADCLSRELAEP